MKKAVLIVAGGKGSRFNNSLPKQFITINNKTILEHTISKFENLSDIIMVVLPQEFYEEYQHLRSQYIHFCVGGESRQDSVFKGLHALQGFKPELVAIHDSVRLFVTEQMISDSFETARQHGSAIPVIPLQDSLWQHMPQQNSLKKSMDRSQFLLSQTPQTFNFEQILFAHEQRKDSLVQYSDCAAIYHSEYQNLHTYTGSKTNIKITTPEDFDYAVYKFKSNDHI